jgi:hypothetical protein
MPAYKIIVGKMLGQDAAWEIENVQRPNSTINRRTDDMLHDAEDVLCDKLKNKKSRLMSQQISPTKVTL